MDRLVFLELSRQPYHKYLPLSTKSYFLLVYQAILSRSELNDGWNTDGDILLESNGIQSIENTNSLCFIMIRLAMKGVYQYP